eukprot:m.20050 g.20050  ORF g.20050 m.20050 type:complete len:57 (+) comp12717_c0_seq1:2044-2214(+)
MNSSLAKHYYKILAETKKAKKAPNFEIANKYSHVPECDTTTKESPKNFGSKSLEST